MFSVNGINIFHQMAFILINYHLATVKGNPGVIAPTKSDVISDFYQVKLNK